MFLLELTELGLLLWDLSCQRLLQSSDRARRCGNGALQRDGVSAFADQQQKDTTKMTHESQKDDTADSTAAECI